MAFTRQATMTQDHTQVTASQTAFPVLVSITNNDFKTIANGGYVANASGYDIRWYSDVGRTSAITTWELVSYDGSAGTIVYYVAQGISSSVDTLFYAAYGDAALNTDASSTTAWDSHFVAVWHLANIGGTLTLKESTSNGYTLTNHNAIAGASGTYDGAMAVPNGTNQYLSNASVTCPNFPTISFWNKVTTANLSVSTAAYYLNGASSSPRCLAHVPFTDHNVYWDYGDASGGRVSTDYTANEGVWTKVDLTKSSIGNSAIYFSGVSAITAATTGSNPGLTGFGIDFYNESSPVYGKNQMFEYRISDIDRGATWLAVEYSNQNTPTVFVTATYANIGATVVPQIMNASRQRRAA